jgi:hypothetical protein
MERDDDLTALPLVDDPTVKDVFAEFCTGLNFVHGNLHMTFASVTADHSANRASSKRIVSARIVARESRSTAPRIVPHPSGWGQKLTRRRDSNPRSPAIMRRPSHEG